MTTKIGSLRLLRAAELFFAITGGAGSLWFMLRVGHRNQSQLLVALFTVWVLSPFAALVIAHVIAKPWQARTRATLCIVTVLISLGSLAIYGDVAFGPQRAQPASSFVLVPPVSLAIMAIGMAMATRSKRSRQLDPPEVP